MPINIRLLPNLSHFEEFAFICGRMCQWVIVLIDSRANLVKKIGIDVRILHKKFDYQNAIQSLME